jgi:hypothetical protein
MTMTHVDTPQSRCRVGFARADITPPVGIYHRMWGAALHDRATGMHRPLRATAVCLEPLSGSGRAMVVGLDHCLLDPSEFARLRASVGRATRIGAEDVHVCMSHTHGSAWMSRSRAELPGGDLIGPYLDRLAEVCADLAKEAVDAARPTTIVYGTGRCSLAAHRDLWDPDSQQFVCGFNPGGPADDTVLVARAVGDDGRMLGTVVNYACHPTTLAWENTLISPDYVGAMREVVEQHTDAPCLFLQGASGDLGPREGFVGDTAVADRNGRQLGFAALGALEALPPPGTRFEYAGAVVSGATLGPWRHRPLPTSERARQDLWQCYRFGVDLPYRIDLPNETETRAQLAQWEKKESAARTANDTTRVRDCRAQVERMNRQLARLAFLPAGKAYPFPVVIRRLGGALWIFTPGELYQVFQTTVRDRFPDIAIVVATLTNDWHPGYVPPAATYGKGIYQETIAAVGPGSLEVLIESVIREIGKLQSAEHS